ncbi:MAG: hypothetical protein U9P12_02755, partial [Verrucomicrobiota bacterium]|nr:hypothetical protein [Verrucomicrobiota bacterium]
NAHPDLIACTIWPILSRRLCETTHLDNNQTTRLRKIKRFTHTDQYVHSPDKRNIIIYHAIKPRTGTDDAHQQAGIKHCTHATDPHREKEQNYSKKEGNE